MLDRDIAEYFGVETKALNRAMKRNIKRFPEEFCFQLTREEYREILRCQSGTLELEQGKYSKYPPYVYTERGGYADFGIAHVLLIDSWSDQEAIDVHHASPMMKQLSELRDKYDLHMTVERFVSEEYESDEKYLRR